MVIFMAIRMRVYVVSHPFYAWLLNEDEKSKNCSHRVK